MGGQYRPGAGSRGSVLVYYDLDATAEKNIKDKTKQINFEDERFQGKAGHPRLVIVKNNEPGAYGQGKLRQMITNMHLTAKGYATKKEVAKALGLTEMEVEAYKPGAGWGSSPRS